MKKSQLKRHFTVVDLETSKVHSPVNNFHCESLSFIEKLTSSHNNIKIYNDTLKAGDYSLIGHETIGDDDSIIIERKKNCNELCNNLGNGWERFCNEMDI